MSKIGAREARSKFSEILHSAAYAKDRIVLTKNGRDIAALVPIEDLRLIESMRIRLMCGKRSGVWRIRSYVHSRPLKPN